LLEGNRNLLQLRQEILLREAEIAAVDDGLAAMESLLAQLADVPTPGGPTALDIKVSTCGRTKEDRVER
jgi:hypothetical protein